MTREERGRSVRAGDVLPALEIPITRTLIVAGALASRDYQDVHHDVELAREKGSPDIFMNILTTNGLVGRYLTDHFGPTAVLQKLAIRLGAPNYPGDTMTLTGTITEVDALPARPTSTPNATATSTASPTTPHGITARVQIIGTNALGNHVTGTATVRLPPPGAAASCASRSRLSPEGTV
ncbi:MaoC family dehydratase [Streptomyces sp. NPDC021749]|uniref:MaoC family dehydratase n=1 Tax=Streptomyces sp. NPDC021749 TaxID=3154905 RepID=UPI0033F11D14